MMITVVFATHNGAETLPATLESMERLHTPDSGWKLIVIDNASTDSTAEILKSFSGRLPLQILYQPKRGKNASLNMAIPYFEGDLIVFTDDDVIPMAEWLVEYIKLTEQYPEISIFAGRIYPHWPGEVPKDIIKALRLGPAFAIHPEELHSGPVNPDKIWGANMAVKAHVFSDGYRFNEQIGPTLGNYTMGSETEFTKRLDNDGFLNWFSNDIIVKHQILEDQLTNKWIFARAVKFGKGNATNKLNQNHMETNGKKYLKSLRWQVWKLIKDLLYISLVFIKKHRVEYINLVWKIGENYGSIIEEFKIRYIEFKEK